MSFLTWIGTLIGNIAADRVERRLDDYFEKKTKINSITTEARVLMGELDNAETPEEKAAIMRKIGNFSDLKHLL